jgi:intracellular multiplication protein IcmB
MDEFHMTGGHDLLREQIMNDGRTARKWNLEIVLASQLMEDFGSLTKIATSFFILDSGTEETRRWLRENIQLSPVEESALQRHVHGAGEHGTTFLARIVTKDATYSQLYTFTAGPMRLWALSTTTEDRKLRNLIYKHMPGNEARQLLARYFPSGSCKKKLDSMKRETFGEAEFVDDAMTASLLERIANDMVVGQGGPGQRLAA